ncbi:MAG: hypothetical protein ACKO3B_10295 [Bacteroidota bacterium]
MTPQQLQGTIRDFPLHAELDGTALKSAMDAAPYSQVLTDLYARYCQDHAVAGAPAALKSAAIRATDRTLLRELMSGQTSTPAPRASVVPAVAQVDAAAAPIAEPGVQPRAVVAEAFPAPASGPSVTPEQLFADMEALKAAMIRFEQTMDELERQTPVDVLPPIEPFTKGVLPAPEVANEVLITEIKSSRKRMKPESSRQAEQLEIIDLFIKSKSAVVRPPDGPVVRQDLTESLDQYSENVISETLVEILIGQGKTSKAIEVLRKLIWKYPQKKHLFAARIQDLSK